MNLIIHLTLFTLAVIFTILSFKRYEKIEERYVEEILYPLLAMILWSVLAVSGVITVDYPEIQQVVNQSGVLNYTYTTYTVEIPIHPINYLYLLFTIIFFMVLIYRVFTSLKTVV